MNEILELSLAGSAVRPLTGFASSHSPVHPFTGSPVDMAKLRADYLFCGRDDANPVLVALPAVL